MTGVEAYSVDSTPADCVRVGVISIGHDYDLVLSGMNRGFNVGRDIGYSGTAGAIMEACGHGYRGVAVSTRPDAMELAAEKYDDVLKFFIENDLLSLNPIYNVNIAPEAKSIRITRQGGPYYCDDFVRQEGDMFLAQGKMVYVPGTDLNVDSHAIMNGHISVTPLTTDVTCTKVFEKFTNKYQLNPQKGPARSISPPILFLAKKAPTDPRIRRCRLLFICQTIS
jgi:5'-nucleotidase